MGGKNIKEGFYYPFTEENISLTYYLLRHAALKDILFIETVE